MDFSSLNPTTSNSLNLAARKNDFHTVRKLLRKKNPNCIDNRGWTCLHEAAAHDSFESLLLILKHPLCRPLAETHEGHTALYLACRHHCRVRTIKTLLESVKYIANYGSTECVTPLHIVSAQGRIEVMQLLIEHGAIINAQDFDGDTPLHDASLAMQNDAVAVLLHAGADPEIKNDADYTPFHLACFKGRYETIQTLLLFVNDINQVTRNGDSALMLATHGCNEEIVKFLLKNGADPHIQNSDGESALDVALTLGFNRIFNTLLLVTDVEKINRDIILNACKPHYFKFEILEDLLNHDLGPEFFNFSETFYVTLEEIGGIRPAYLTNAPLNSYLNICEYIYKRSYKSFTNFFYLFLMGGVGVDAVNKDECPPLVYIHYCSHNACFVEVFKILRQHGCNVDYCSISTKDTKLCFPDAFIASLSSDPSTASLMIPYSLYCEPGDLLLFAYENGVLNRVSPQVQSQLLSMIDVSLEGTTAEYLSHFVLPLKHFCRLKIRSILKNRGINNTEEFIGAIENLQLPVLLKNYLRYL